MNILDVQRNTKCLGERDRKGGETRIHTDLTRETNFVSGPEEGGKRRRQVRCVVKSVQEMAFFLAERKRPSGSVHPSHSSTKGAYKRPPISVV
jgi:hypothetical protein